MVPSDTERVSGTAEASQINPGVVGYSASLESTALLSFSIDHPLVAKQRVSWSKTGRAYTPKETRDFEAKVKMVAWAAMQKAKLKVAQSVPVSLHLQFYFAVPKSLSGPQKQKRLGTPHINRPDLTNLCKAIEDGCNGVVYHDDCQISSISMTKRWGTAPCVKVLFEWIENGQ